MGNICIASVFKKIILEFDILSRVSYGINNIFIFQNITFREQFICQMPTDFPTTLKHDLQ